VANDAYGFRTPQVILFSADVERAALFYCGLGFTETFRVPTAGQPIHIDVSLDGYTIGIASAASTRDDHGLDPMTTGQRAAVVLWSDDTAAAVTKLAEAGVPVLTTPHRWLDRLLIAWVADPDGHPIQLVQRL
jgi:catechol 2,3-dioxygenase-like lactoylglutathione lyase family enzyme